MTDFISHFNAALADKAAGRTSPSIARACASNELHCQIAAARRHAWPRLLRADFHDRTGAHGRQ